MTGLDGDLGLSCVALAVPVPLAGRLSRSERVGREHRHWQAICWSLCYLVIRPWGGAELRAKCYGGCNLQELVALFWGFQNLSLKLDRGCRTHQAPWQLPQALE